MLATAVPINNNINNSNNYDSVTPIVQAQLINSNNINNINTIIKSANNNNNVITNRPLSTTEIIPIPMNELSPTPINQLENFSYEVDHDGKLYIENRPTCTMIVFMLPYPFFCAGCFYSVSSNMLFNDNTKTLTIRSWPGFCFCLTTKETLIEYSQIGNIGVEASKCDENKRTMYYPVIILRDRRRIYYADAEALDSLELKVLALHKFIFGRFSNNYHVPLISSLMAHVN